MRHKSPERIQFERDRAIRRERRERKKAEKEAKRRVRQEKCWVREQIAKNGLPKVELKDGDFSLREAMKFDPHVICEGCHRIVHESELHENSLCDLCFYPKEVIRDEQELKSEAQEKPGAEPLTTTAPILKVPPSGQLKLELS